MCIEKENENIEDDFLDEEDVEISENDFCEICDIPAKHEYDGTYYCEDCYDTQILHN